MATDNIIDRLATHRTLADAPRAQLEWLAARGQLRRFEQGDVIMQPGWEILDLFVVLSGRFSIIVDRGAGPRKAMEWRGGDVTGYLPYSRLNKAPGTSIAEEQTEILTVPRTALPDMIRDCHELTAILVHVMLDRTRRFTSNDLLDEKMASLGRLAAGLAHELNNPASAVVRSAKELAGRLADVDRASLDLGAAGLSASRTIELASVRDTCVEAGARVVHSPLEQADREDAMTEWLERHGGDTAVAAALADSTLVTEDLDRLAGSLDTERMHLAVRWIAASCAVGKLTAEIEAAAARIHALVAAVKGFTYMDQATTPKPVNIEQGLIDTLAVVRSKARAKQIGVNVEVTPGLPLIQGFGGELNQVWANLLENALDAAPASGHVQVTAVRESTAVVVRVIDDGPGIPPEIRDRIFDPFFTTKPVGQGVGLGLDIVRRIVERHDGFIEADSRPGRTEFRVTLPVKS